MANFQSYWYQCLVGVQNALKSIAGMPTVRIRKRPVRMKTDPLPFVIVSPTDDEVLDETFAGLDGGGGLLTNDRVLVMSYGVQITYYSESDAELESDIDVVMAIRQNIRQQLYDANPLNGTPTVYDCEAMELGEAFDLSALENNYDKSVIGFKFKSKEPASG